MLAIFKLNVRDSPSPLPLGRPPSKQSDQPKGCRGILFFQLCYPQWGFLSLPPSPHSVLQPGTSTSLHCSPRISPAGRSVSMNLPRSLQSRVLRVAYISRVEEMLLPKGRNSLVSNITDYHSERIFSRDTDTQLYCSLTITNTSSKLQVNSAFVT